MRKKSKKLMLFLSLLLSTAIMFSACASKKNTDNDVPDSAENTSQEETVHRLKLMGPSKFGGNYVKWEDRSKFPAWQLFEEGLKERKLELEYEFVVPEQYATVIQTRMAAAVNLPDIVNISPLDDTTALSLGSNGTIIDINGAIDSYSDGTIKQKYEGNLSFSKRLTTAPDGKRYWFATAIAGNNIILNNGKSVPNLEIIGSAIRKDWLDKLGLPIPSTVEEWKSALKAFRDNDMNGNGVKDEVLLFDPYSYSFFTGIAQWFGLVPDIIALDTSSNKVVSPWYQEGVKDYFKLMNDLAKEGIFDVSLVGATDEVGNQRIAENKISGLRSYSIASWFEDLVKGVENAEYAILPPLTAKKGITPFMLCDAADLSFDKFAITKNCKDVKGAIKLFDYVFSDDFSRLSFSGVEGEDYVLDSQGKATVIDPKLTREAAYKQNKGSIGIFIHNNIFPRLQSWISSTPTKAEELLEKLPNDKQRAGARRRLDLLEYRPYVTSPFSSTMYAIASPEELEITNKYFTALKTYSEELSMNLILGNESLDKWDTYIKKLQDLGLDKMIKVYSDRYNRYKEAK